MLVAVIYPEAEIGRGKRDAGKKAAETSDFSERRLQQARTVLRYSVDGDLANDVLAGARLNGPPSDGLRDAASWALSSVVRPMPVKRAMLVAMIYPKAKPGKSKASQSTKDSGISADYVRRARTILNYSVDGDLANDVLGGASLDAKYAKAIERKNEAKAAGRWATRCGIQSHKNEGLGKKGPLADLFPNTAESPNSASPKPERCSPPRFYA